MPSKIVVIAALVGAGVRFAGAQSSEPSIHARLFADFNYYASQRPTLNGFRNGQIAGHIAATISDRLSLFSEVTGTSQAAGFAVEAERFMVRYDVNDRFKISAGRFHTPGSYWNTTFHHGAWLQTTAGRPDLARGSGLLPFHFVGLEVEGAIPVGPLSVSYIGGVGNGRGVNIARAGDAGDINSNRAFVLASSMLVPRLTALRVGGAYYSDRATPTTTLSVGERIVSAFIARERETPEVIVEYALVSHDPRSASSPSTISSSGYAQVGYRLPGSAWRFKPYFRIDRTAIASRDTLLVPLGLEYRGGTTGLRIDIDPLAAIKIEFRRERLQVPGWLNTLTAQFSFTFPGMSANHGAHEIATHGGGDHAAAGSPSKDRR